MRLRASLLVGVAVWAGGVGTALAQTRTQTITLDTVTVYAPSPIQSRTPGTNELPLGVLPIVTDQFATVTVLPTEEIVRTPGATLGDLLFSKPGITGSSFAPGAASRPIIRGLDVNRVGIVANGLPAGGVSDLGEDHFVPIDPLTTNRIEVIRGPATLRYGSQAIGGVVSASDNRIPEFVPQRGFMADLRGAVTSVDRSLDGAILIDAGKNNFAIHGDVFGRTAEDYRVPSYPYRVAPNQAELPAAAQPGTFNGRQPNSALTAHGGAIGGSFFFTGGYAGVAVVQNNTNYRTPGVEGDGHKTRIDAEQIRGIGKGEFRPGGTAVDTIRFWWGATNYKHNEIQSVIHQTFTNREFEARTEVQLMPFNLRFVELTTAFGIQAGTQRLTASSPNDIGSTLNGLFDPNRNTRFAGYIFNEFRFSPVTKAQIATRIEQVNLTGNATTFPGAEPIFNINTDPTSVGPAFQADRSFTPKSVSVGLIQNLPLDLVASITGQYVERAPKPAELYSRGVHHATETFDIGSPNLRTEVAKSVEIGLRHGTGPVRFEATTYYTGFEGFIYRRLTGKTCDEASCVSPLAEPLELKQAVYTQQNATFRGAEFQFQWDVLPIHGGFAGVEGQYDFVHATFAGGGNVPRIPPHRLGGGVYYRSAEWLARVFLLHAFDQNRVAIADDETRTEGYNLLKAEISHTRKFPENNGGLKQLTIGLVGTNLLNENIRNHVSFTKEMVLMPGASARLFARALF